MSRTCFGVHYDYHCCGLCRPLRMEGDIEIDPVEPDLCVQKSLSALNLFPPLYHRSLFDGSWLFFCVF